MTKCEGVTGPPGGIEEHLQLEADLRRLRQLRDAGDPGFKPEAEDAVLDQMETIWSRMSPEERRLLEVRRAIIEG